MDSRQMSCREVLRNETVGRRIILGINHPVVKQLVELRCPGERPRYLIQTLCNGLAQSSRVYLFRAEAEAAFDARVVDQYPDDPEPGPCPIYYEEDDCIYWCRMASVPLASDQ